VICGSIFFLIGQAALRDALLQIIEPQME